jgi:transposase InsO family protein
MIGLNTATYYHRPVVSRAEREKFDADLRDQIERVQLEHPRAGYRMVLGYLRRLGVRVGERRIRRVMRQFGLQARIKKAFVRTTDSRHSHRCYPNLLPGKKITGVNQVWVSDLTYIRIENGFVYLAVIMDLYSRKIVGWNVSKRIDGELALGALDMAIGQRRPNPGLIHHSDRGVQYLCGDYVRRLKEHGIEISNSAKGNPYHNAFAESLMKTLKQEEVYLGNYLTFLDVIENLPAFIEQVYNEKRIHSRLDYLTPVEVERLAESNKTDGRFDLEL